MATDNEINEAIARWRGWKYAPTPEPNPDHDILTWQSPDDFLPIPHWLPGVPDCLHDAAACLEALQYVMRQDELYAGCPDAPIALDLSARSDGAYWCGLPIYTDAYNIKTVEGRGATLTEAIARAIYAAITEGQG